MRRNLVILFLCAAIITLLIVAGCAPSQPPAPTSVVPTSCSLTVVSQCLACYGYVWVNGASTGEYITNNGSVTLIVPCGQVRVEIRDELGYVSHTEYVNTPQQNMVIFTYW
ncbi:MAG TPA: hypothetical protein DF698_06555 [Candidatus Atribacteria bacterium]|nr:hypothetical protein [Candidatus Atribacteria bacterium]